MKFNSLFVTCPSASKLNGLFEYKHFVVMFRMASTKGTCFKVKDLKF